MTNMKQRNKIPNIRLDFPKLCSGLRIQYFEAEFDEILSESLKAIVTKKEVNKIECE